MVIRQHPRCLKASSKRTIDLTNSLTGPVVDHIKSEAARTEQELRELKNARVTPLTTTATGQHLTCMW